ncbi:hypothetical protein WG66_009108 [Moniliophthora roreri]|nr:hypothetical protein WG66_009108 [Moniliophthora roreri]
MPENPAETIAGPFLIGVLINCILFGIVLLQTHMYYCRFPEDPKWLKIHIGILLSIDTLNTVILLWWIYKLLGINDDGLDDCYMFVSHDFRLTKWQAHDPFWTTCPLAPFMVALLSTMTQMFFTWRLYIFSQSKVLLVFLSALSLASLAGGLALFIEQNKHTGLDLATIATLHILRILSKLWIIPGVVADIAISGTLIWYLHNSRTGLRQTDKLINMIIKVVIASGLATAVVASVDCEIFKWSFTLRSETVLTFFEVIVFQSLQRSSTHLGFTCTLAQLYPISLLSNLHARHSFRAQKANDVLSPIGSSFLARSPERDEPIRVSTDGPDV